MNIRGLIAASLLAAVGASPAMAIVDISVPGTTIATVLADPDRQFIVGDKLFTITNYFSVAMPANSIGISPIINANPLTGIGFRLSGAMNDNNSFDGIATDLALSYSVEVLPAYIREGYRITDSHLAFNGVATLPGSFAGVAETLFDANQNVITQSNVLVQGNGQPPVYQDNQYFAPQTRINVVKDGQWFAVPGGVAASSFIDQLFSQTIIPTPGATGLLIAAGLVASRRRR
jgi:hypothetical protein